LAGGLGYRLNAPLRTIDQISINEEVTLYTHLLVKDDSLKLYGFKTPFERDLFLKITSVSGVGAATALLLLSKIPPKQFMDAVNRENSALLQSVKGIGVRTAKRLILDLKGKIEWTGQVDEEGKDIASEEPAPSTELSHDLMSALLSLGYPRAMATEAASRALTTHPETDDLEILIKTALLGL